MIVILGRIFSSSALSTNITNSELERKKKKPMNIVIELCKSLVSKHGLESSFCTGTCSDGAAAMIGNSLEQFPN